MTLSIPLHRFKDQAVESSKLGDTHRDSWHGSRRDFVRSSVLAGVALTGGAALKSTTAAARPQSTARSDKLSIKIAGYSLDRVDALIDGRVEVAGCDAKYEIAAIGDMNSDALGGPMTREVTEIGLSPYMLAYANDGLRNHTLLPVFPLRLFRHKSIFIRPDRGIEKPEDLRGKKVATPGYSSTSLTWIRGIMQHEYGVKPDEIQWYVSAEDSSAGAAGKVSKNEQLVPEGIAVREGPAGKDESDMLVDGDVDALFHAAEPEAFREGNPDCIRLFPDSRQTEREYYTKTGLFPIMHAVAVRLDVVNEHPWFLKAVFDAYCQAKQLAYKQMKSLGWATNMLPWYGQELHDTIALMGENFWPYGIEPNRKTLEALFRYSHEQGLSSRRLSIEELFHPATLRLIDTSA
ncbi:MAG: ABC transporter substrate-binding protein [Planctomycetota bacterium]|jgi:4,5-dihydroxyphthalate decarboxylase